MISRIFVAAVFSLPAPAAAQTAAPLPPKPAPCADAMHHAFDFWIGRWDVHPYAGGPLVAHSLIESLYAGCAIRENWMPIKGAGGGSLSNYDSGDGRWHQTWVDSSGARAVFDGGFKDGAMVISGPWRGSGPKGEDGVVRMTYTKERGGAVRQKGEVSIDRGHSWVPSFDFLYTPAGAE